MYCIVAHLLRPKMIEDRYYPTGHVYLYLQARVRVKFYGQKK